MPSVEVPVKQALLKPVKQALLKTKSVCQDASLQFKHSILSVARKRNLQHTRVRPITAAEVVDLLQPLRP